MVNKFITLCINNDFFSIPNSRIEKKSELEKYNIQVNHLGKENNY